MLHIRLLVTTLTLAVCGLVAAQYSAHQSEYYEEKWRNERPYYQAEHSVSYAVRHVQWVAISGSYQGHYGNYVSPSVEVWWDQKHNAPQIACLSKSNRFHAKQWLSKSTTGKEYQVLIGVNPYPSSCKASFNYIMDTGELGDRVDGWCDTPQAFQKLMWSVDADAKRAALAQLKKALASLGNQTRTVPAGTGQIIYPHYCPPQ